MFSIRKATPDDGMAVAKLIFHSTNEWYESHGFGKIFPGPPEDCRLFFDVYEDLDPGCCLVAEHTETGQLIGSCFYHPRDTHLSLGIMNSDGAYAGNGVAKALLQSIVEIAEARKLPLRLFSSAMNLDSFSLYTRQMFAPYAVFQDLLITVPEQGVSLETVSTSQVRSATVADIPAVIALEEKVWGVRREKDWQYFVDNQRNIWDVLLYEEAGQVQGVLASVNHLASKMLGPGVATTASVAAALIISALNRFRGQTMVFLVPSANTELVQLMYQLGARNCELHFGQTRGAVPQINGVVMPTFMPETG